MILAALVASATPRDAQAVVSRDLSVFLGAERATLGAWFGKLAFGGTEAPKLPEAPPGVKVELVRIGQRIDGVDLTAPADSCDELQSRLAKLWGTPNDEGHDYGEGWISKSGLQGAVFEGNSGFDLPCRLHFFRRVSPEQWLNSSSHSVVPIWAIGKPVADLEAAIAVMGPEHDEHGMHWQDTAIDGAHVTLTAELRGRRVVRVTVQTEIGTSTKPVWQRLLAMFGKPDPATIHEDTVLWRWRRMPGIELGTFAGDLPPRTPPRTPVEPGGFPVSISFGVTDR